MKVMTDKNRPDKAEKDFTCENPLSFFHGLYNQSVSSSFKAIWTGPIILLTTRVDSTLKQHELLQHPLGLVFDHSSNHHDVGTRISLPRTTYVKHFMYWIIRLKTKAEPDERDFSIHISTEDNQMVIDSVEQNKAVKNHHDKIHNLDEGCEDSLCHDFCYQHGGFVTGVYIAERCKCVTQNNDDHQITKSSHPSMFSLIVAVSQDRSSTSAI